MLFQAAGVTGCLWGSVLFAAAAGALSLRLPTTGGAKLMSEMKLKGASD